LISALTLGPRFGLAPSWYAEGHVACVALFKTAKEKKIMVYASARSEMYNSSLALGFSKR
jgi:hypothetical protein